MPRVVQRLIHRDEGLKVVEELRAVERADGKIAPRVKGSAYVNAEATLLLDDRDPFCWGIR